MEDKKRIFTALEEAARDPRRPEEEDGM